MPIRERVAWPLEHREERVTLSFDLVTGMAREDSTDDRVVPRQQLRVALPETVEQSRRALDVGE
jgi:hypothetical protein